MQRRAFVAGLITVSAPPRSGQAQQPEKIYKIAHLMFPRREQSSHQVSALEDGLRERGYVRGRNIVIEHRFAEGNPERLPGLATELVRLSPDVIVTGTNPSVVALKQVTSVIPIVAVSVVDPVGAGFVESLARPGRNITGLTWDIGSGMWGKYLDLVRAVVPTVRRVALLWDSSIPDLLRYPIETQRAAQALGITLQSIETKGPDGLGKAFTAMARERAEAVLAIGGQRFYAGRHELVGLAARSKLPTIYTYREAVQEGGLMAYAPSLSKLWRRAAIYVDKILKGAKAADLPVEQPSEIELVINLKTAKALGLTIPPSLLLRADQVIE